MKDNKIMETTTKTNKTDWKNQFMDIRAYQYASGAWSALNQRCIGGLYSTNPSIVNNAQHKSYHSKGITLDITKEDFIRFMVRNEKKIVEIIESGDKPSIDRIDGTIGYEKGNMQIISMTSNRWKETDMTEEPTQGESDPVMFRIANRRQYIKNKPVGTYESYYVDKYIMGDLEHGWLTHLGSIIRLGLFPNAYYVVDNTRSYDDSYVSSVLESLIEENQVRFNEKMELEAKLELKRKEFEDARELLMKKKEIKNHPRYNDVREYVLKRKQSLRGGNTKVPAEFDLTILTATPREAILAIIEADWYPTKVSIIEVRKQAPVAELPKGISYDNRLAQYIAQFTYKKVKYWVGRFDTVEEAVEALQLKKNEIII